MVDSCWSQPTPATDNAGPSRDNSASTADCRCGVVCMPTGPRGSGDSLCSSTKPISRSRSEPRGEPPAADNGHRPLMSVPAADREGYRRFGEGVKIRDFDGLRCGGAVAALDQLSAASNSQAPRMARRPIGRWAADWAALPEIQSAAPVSTVRMNAEEELTEEAISTGAADVFHRLLAAVVKMSPCPNPPAVVTETRSKTSTLSS